MIVVPKWAVLTFACAVGVYTDVVALIAMTGSSAPLTDLIGLLLLTVALAVSLTDIHANARMATWRAIFSSGATIALPVLGSIGLDPRVDSYSSGAWHVAGVTCVVVVLLWRRRTAFAWVTFGAFAVQTALWGGLVALNTIGVVAVGLLLALVAAGGWLIRRTEEDLDRFSSAERETLQWQAAQDAYHFERQIRLSTTALTAGAMLRRIAETGGRLDAVERAECRVLEQTIRDETRGRRLLSTAVREQVAAHRRRGATVQVNDDGGIDDIPPAAMEPLLAQIASALAGLTSDRIVIRTAPRDSPRAVSLVAMSSDPVAAALGLDDGDDQVDLWLELNRPVEA